MSNCSITSGIGVTCDDLRKPGGLAKRVWIANLDAFRTAIDVTLETYITNLDFTTYASLYLFESTKFSHEYSWTQQKGDGGNVSYQVQLIMRLFNNDPTDDKAIEDLGVADVVAIVQTYSNEFLILGAGNGMSAADGTQGGSGRNTGDATTSQITLQGAEQYLPKRLLIGGSAANTLSALNAMVA